MFVDGLIEEDEAHENAAKSGGSAGRGPASARINESGQGFPDIASLGGTVRHIS